MRNRKLNILRTSLWATLLMGLLVIGGCSDLFGPADNPKDPLNADKRTYTVTYDGNGQTSGSVPVDSLAYLKDAVVTVLPNSGSVAKTGYSFVGWSTTADTVGPTYIAGNTFVMGATNQTLYARWAPGAPTGLTASPGPGSVSLSWTAVPSATGYNVYWSTTSGVTTATGTKVSVVTNSFTQSGLTYPTTYYYVVTAVLGGAESGATGQLSATPQNNRPTGLSAISGNQQITLSWNLLPGASSYKVYYATGSTATTSDTALSQNLIAGNGTGTSATISSLTNGVQYAFIVVAQFSGVDGPPSAALVALPGSVPLAPQGLTTVSNDSQITVRWNPVAGTTGYKVFYAPGSTASSGDTQVSASMIAGTTATVTGLNNGTQYAFVVVASNDNGDSFQSSSVAETPWPTTFTFDNASQVSGWHADTSVGGLYAHATIPSLGGTYTHNTDTGFVHQGTGSLKVTGTWNTQDGSGWDRYGKGDAEYPSSGSLNLTGTTKIEAWVFLPTELTGYAAQLFVVVGPAFNTYFTTQIFPSPNVWTKISFDVSGIANLLDVRSFIVGLSQSTGADVTPGTGGYFYIDSITFIGSSYQP